MRVFILYYNVRNRIVCEIFYFNIGFGKLSYNIKVGLRVIILINIMLNIVFCKVVLIGFYFDSFNLMRCVFWVYFIS